MSIIFEERASDSLLVETIMQGRTECAGVTIRPAEMHWHMVLVKYRGHTQILVVGPWTTSGAIAYPQGAELLWIKLKLGAFMPHLPMVDFLDTETPLPAAASHSFWLRGSAWQFPTYENADTFVDRLVRSDILTRDPLVNAVLEDQEQETPSRTIRHRFRRSTGLTQSHIRQVQRAQHAERLLLQGVSILDTVDEAGYFDQPHLTRSLKQFTGYTPAQILQMRNLS